ncbi:MAG: transglutaminase domain-containing protein, partial [Clostridia bacterium]|nr:transglutaminase domain-containing protein [Clostridia bacterium]
DPAPDVPYTPAYVAPAEIAANEELIADVQNELGASVVNAPARTEITYARRLPISCELTVANSREELIEIADFYAFYRESGFTVTLGYAVTDAEAELTAMYRQSCFLPSLCSVSGSLSGNSLTVSLIFYPESYLISPRTTVERDVLGGENTPPNGTDTLPGLDPEHGVSVWDSEQACYALSKGYTISPIEGSPAEALVNAAQTILREIIDDTMTPWQVAYRVYHWLAENSEYDYAGDTQAGRAVDRVYEPDLVPSRMISFRAEGPITYGVGVCFGYAKASTLLLGLEGIRNRRVTAFAVKGYLEYEPGRAWTRWDVIQVHSYNYLRIDGFDYIFDLSFVKNGIRDVYNVTTSSYDRVLTLKDYALGLSKEEHKTVYPEFPDDPWCTSVEYNPGSFHYLTEITYDGTHKLLLASTAEAQAYYQYLLTNVFSQPAACRIVTLFYAAWTPQLESQLESFLDQTDAVTGGYHTSPNPASANPRTGAAEMVIIVFNK